MESRFRLPIQEKNISLETWLQDYADIARSTFMDWKAAASGKPVNRKVSEAKARKFEEAIRQEAMELGLIPTVHDV